MKRYLSQYLWVGLAALLVIAALFVPQGWFALRDAASLNRTHGETLSPLMVAQLNRSYERDINERMSVFMNALAMQDVICSSKEIDPGNESLWENIRQAESSLMMEWLMDASFIRNAEAQGWEPVIESCVQYVLMRQSDGQILLVANDIYLDRGDGRHREFLLDGVDGTVYYLDEEDNSDLRIGRWMDGYLAWHWWQMLNTDYHTEDAELLHEDVAVEDIAGYIDKKRAKSYSESNVFDADVLFDELTPEGREAVSAGWVQIFSDSSPHIWVFSSLNKDIYCCQLYFGEIADSWSMETEELQEDEGTQQYRVRLGLAGVVQAIPEMAKRISLAKYDQIYQ